MAHRIEKIDKQQGLEMGWHQLTEIYPGLSLTDNFLRSWDLVPVVLEKKGQPSKWTILECSDLPGVEIGKPYNPETFKPVTNADFLGLVQASISGTPHTVVSVGSVRSRGRVFVSIKLNGMETFEAAGRKFSAYLNFGNGHDKSSVLWVTTSNICTVCDNTFTCNLFSVENKDASAKANADDVAIARRHTKNVVMNLPALATLIDKAVGVQGEFAATFDAMSKSLIGHDTAKSLFAGFVGRKVEAGNGLSTRALNTVDRLTSLFATGKGNRGESRADAFSAVTDYYTHLSAGNSDNPEKQFLSSEFGAGRDAKGEFWGILTAKDDKAFEPVVRRGESLLAHTKVVA